MFVATLFHWSSPSGPVLVSNVAADGDVVYVVDKCIGVPHFSQNVSYREFVLVSCAELVVSGRCVKIVLRHLRSTPGHTGCKLRTLTKLDLTKWTNSVHKQHGQMAPSNNQGGGWVASRGLVTVGCSH